jgi:hypothetical protein
LYFFCYDKDDRDRGFITGGVASYSGAYNQAAKQVGRLFYLNQMKFPMEGKMNAKNHKWISIVILFLVTLLVMAGCQSVAKVQPTGAPQPTATPIVVIEGEALCSVSDFNQAQGIDIEEPELGKVTRGMVATYAINCGVPYVTEKCIEIQDGHFEGDVFHWTSIFECITDEGGVWKGTCDSTLGETAVCTSNGDGKYKGLQLYTDADLNTYNMKYRITRLVGE